MADLFDILLAKNLAGGGVKPQGEIEITENGEYDVTEYASANVNVPNKIGKIMVKIGTDITAKSTIAPKATVTIGA